MATFIKDIEEIRQRAMRKIEDGAVTNSYTLDKNRVVDILNEALATEIVCVLRYMHHYFMATGVHGKAVADEFKEHADEERAHADLIGERIQQLGGSPDLNPGTLLQRSVAQYVEGETLADMIKEDLIAERTVIDVYQRMIDFFGNADPTTRRMIEHIKEEEEEHASDLSDMLYIVDPRTGESEGRDPGTDALTLESSRSGSAQQSQAARTARAEADESQRTSELVGNRGASNLPGVSGRPMNRRSNRDEIDTDEIADRPNAGGSGGTNRSPKILQKNRKGKRAA